MPASGNPAISVHSTSGARVPRALVYRGRDRLEAGPVDRGVADYNAQAPLPTRMPSSRFSSRWDSPTRSSGSPEASSSRPRSPCCDAQAPDASTTLPGAQELPTVRRCGYAATRATMLSLRPSTFARRRSRGTCTCRPDIRTGPDDAGRLAGTSRVSHSRDALTDGSGLMIAQTQAQPTRSGRGPGDRGAQLGFAPDQSDE